MIKKMLFTLYCSTLAGFSLADNRTMDAAEFLFGERAVQNTAEEAMATRQQEKKGMMALQAVQGVESAKQPNHAPRAKTMQLSDEELLAQPALLQRALDSAIELGNLKGIRALLPLYQMLPEKDEILALYGQALLARADGKHEEAVRLYRQIMAINPNLTPMRLQLAITLFENHENVAAEDQFEKIRSSEGLPEPVQEVIEQYITQIQKRGSWSINAGVQYTEDSNINNAPKKGNYGQWKLPKAESARGLAYSVDIGKDIPLRNHWFLNGQLTADGESYWNNHDYDELIGRLSLGAGWRSARNKILVSPFFEHQRKGNQAYANMSGVHLQGSRWLTGQWQWFASGEYGRKKHQLRHHLDGHSLGLSSGVLYLHSPKQYWLFSSAWNRQTAKDTSSAYRRVSVAGGWGQEWFRGLSSYLQIGTAKRHYQAADFTGIQRKDNEYFAKSSLWLRNIHFKGITPRLTFSWYRDDSNHFMYDYQKTRTFLELGKKF